MGLGTGRRGMKSPPLLIAVLLACVFVLGINYWITSSRCVELQESLVNNITTKDYVIQKLQVQISGLHRRLEESKLEFKELQESQTKKLSYELAQCSSKITEVKEQCDERLRKAGVKDANTANEHTEKTVIETEKLKPTTKQQSNAHKDDDKEEAKSKNNLKPATIPPSKDDKKEVIPPPEIKEETNDLELNVDEKKPSAALQNPKQDDHKDVVQEPGNQINPVQEPGNQINPVQDPGNQINPVQDPGNQINPDNVNAADEDDEPKVEDAEDQDTNKENEDVERENLMNIDGQQEDEKDLKQNEQEDDAENPNEYNGDEANVAESEAEKQAQLNDNKPNLKDNKIQIGVNGQAADQEAEDNPT
ncbi:Golgi membrane protein 1 isoform X2 [Rana temporaria]|uniref:Golgi membrane protein 1 isoform X2 n=1 Tax=Rana temporaria TaxID=8407 RepID=UPI001AADA550|nr:Golgi membrane protein 1 isoform X2 [Rana temporaria]